MSVIIGMIIFGIFFTIFYGEFGYAFLFALLLCIMLLIYNKTNKTNTKKACEVISYYQSCERNDL